MTTAERIIEAIHAAGAATARGCIRRQAHAEILALHAANKILAPLVPAGTLRWLAHPHSGESVVYYAHRAVETAAARSAWAGGLLDGTSVYPDAAAAQSVAAILR